MAKIKGIYCTTDYLEAVHLTYKGFPHKLEINLRSSQKTFVFSGDRKLMIALIDEFHSGSEQNIIPKQYLFLTKEIKRELVGRDNYRINFYKNESDRATIRDASEKDHSR